MQFIHIISSLAEPSQMLYYCNSCRD